MVQVIRTSSTNITLTQNTNYTAVGKVYELALLFNNSKHLFQQSFLNSSKLSMPESSSGSSLAARPPGSRWRPAIPRHGGVVHLGQPHGETLLKAAEFAANGGIKWA